MLTEVCNYVHNYFELEVHSGTYEITNGSIELDFLRNGQRFKVVGSALNDGIYTWHDDSIMNDDNTEAVALLDESFTGAVIAMGVPLLFSELVRDIKAWVAKNKTALESPYQSESFGGYSYTKASGNSSGSGGGVFGWQNMFRSRLNAYRKIA